MSKEQKKGLGVPRPKKSGSVSASNLPPKKAKGFPSTPSRKRITPAAYRKLMEQKYEYELMAEHPTEKKIRELKKEFKEYCAWTTYQINRLEERMNTQIKTNAHFTSCIAALGIAAKNPQRDSARIRSGKPDPKGNAQKKKQRS